MTDAGKTNKEYLDDKAAQRSHKQSYTTNLSAQIK